MRFVVKLVSEVSVELYHCHQHHVLNACTIQTLERNWKHGCTSLRIKMYSFSLSFSFSPSSILGVQEPYAVSGLFTDNFEVAPRWLAKVCCNSFWCCSQLCYIVRKFLEVALGEWHAKCGTVCHDCLTFIICTCSEAAMPVILLAIVLPTCYRHYWSHWHASVVMSFKMVALGCTMVVA